MGLTPLEGLLMGTRPGDLDPGAVLYLVGREEMGAHEVDVLLNKDSGLFGISGVSSDMREVLAEAAKGNARAEQAVDVFCYRAAKYIAAYFVALNRADAVVFAGGIGENSPPIRARICALLGALGIHLDDARNESAVGRDQEIGVAGSRPRVWVIPTDEELLIARDTLRVLEGLPHP